ncbi:MAG: hypothetical protein NNC23_03220 [Candidatus Nanosynbacter sp. P2B_S1_bin.0.1]|nr:hypothetical protein [Candidatus Nanosynbacter sp. P2B_S1_bin.0.1]
MHTSNCAADDTKLSKPNRFYSVWFAFLLIVWPLVAVLGLYALGQPLPSLSLLTSPRFLTMQIIVDYSMALAFVACALLFNKRTAKHANVINELRRELAVFKDENGELQDELAKSKDENGELQDELASVRAELREAKLELRRAGEYAEFNERCYESLRKEYSETTLDLLKTRRERDDLRSKLVLARKVIRRLLAERNRLQRKLAKARIGFGFYRREYVNAEARVADALRQIKGLESDIEMRDKVISSLLDDVVIRTKG